ncbi:MAG TPA: hypothetical protein VM008_06205 [Phycisphaerae bacterium]|nr:hypothetical protein [Phycisphaerae bacterium]
MKVAGSLKEKPPCLINFNLALARDSSIGYAVQDLIDKAPAFHQELLAYSLYHAYLSIRFPEILKSPRPEELATIEAGHQRYISINQAVFVFDFAPPTFQPRKTILSAVRARRHTIHVFTQPDLIETWELQTKAWAPSIQKRICIQTVPSWLCMGIDLLTVFSWESCRNCLRRLITLTNDCLTRSSPGTLWINVRTVARPRRKLAALSSS